MKLRLRTFGVVLAALLPTACEVAPDSTKDEYQPPHPAVHVELRGAGSASDLSLKSRVDAFVEDERTLRIQLNNTAPDDASTVARAPYLTRLALNLPAGVDSSCVEVLRSPATPAFEAVAGDVWPCEEGQEEPFDYGLRVSDGENGLPRAANATVRLHVVDDCADRVSFAESDLIGTRGSKVDGVPVQWAAWMEQVGPDGADRGCLGGSAEAAPEPKSVPRVWTYFRATTAETEPIPSTERDDDTRAGSVSAAFSERLTGDGRRRISDNPAAIVALRDPVGSILEEWHLDVPFPAKNLDENDCDANERFPKCYLFSDPDEPLSVSVPRIVADSNAGFDQSGERATVSGQVTLGPIAGTNETRTMRVRWEDPVSIRNVRIDLRVQSDGNVDGKFDDDPPLPLVRLRWPGSGSDIVERSVVRVIEDTETVYEVEVNVDAATDLVWSTYYPDGSFGTRAP